VRGGPRRERARAAAGLAAATAAARGAARGDALVDRHLDLERVEDLGHVLDVVKLDVHDGADDLGGGGGRDGR